MKIIIIIIGMSITLVIFSYLSCRNGENEIYILPRHFKGIVTIIFDQPNGSKIKYENGERIYEIPPNGILKTKFRKNEGWHNLPVFYYLSSKGNFTQIPYAPDISQLSIDTTKVYGYNTGINGNKKTEYVYFAMFFVSTKKELDSLSKTADKLHPLDMIK